MIPDQYRPIIEKLEARTLECEVNWNQTAAESFAVNFGEFTLSIREYHGTDEYGQGEASSVDFRLLNAEGKTIDGFDIWENDEDYRYAANFYSTVRRSAFRVDEALRVLSDALDREPTVGIEEKSLVDEDDIPF